LNNNIEQILDIDELENQNNAANIILDKLSIENRLNSEGYGVEGPIKYASLKMLLFEKFFNYKFKKGQSWGNLINDVKVSEYRFIEKIFDKIIEKLSSENIIRVKENYSIRDNDVIFTRSGYLNYMELKESSKRFEFLEERIEDETSKKEVEKSAKVMEFEVDDVTLKKEILQITYDSKRILTKDLFEFEVKMRILQKYSTEARNYNELEFLKREKFIGFDDAVNQIKKIIWELYRMNQINYDNSGYYSKISITSLGIAALTTEVSPLNNVEIAPKLTETTIIHITDLHFGSSEVTNVDNKAGLDDISDIAMPNFHIFNKAIQAIKDENGEEVFVVVSGDLTTRNEKEGFKKAKDFLDQLDINKDKLFVVPGNHDFDKTAVDEEDAFSKFRQYTSMFANPFIKSNYILDPIQKIFIFGFNTVHSTEIDGKKVEVIYVSEKDIKILEDLCLKLKKEIEDFEKYTKVAVMHHNLIPHPGIEIKEYSENLNLFQIKTALMELGFIIALSGHKHTPLIEKHHVFLQRKESEMLFISGGTLFGPPQHGKNSFQVINIKKEENTGDLFSVEVITYEKDHREFVEVYKKEITLLN